MADKNSKKPGTERLKVLLVDDDEVTLFVTKNQVEKLGYVGLTCASGAEALKILEKDAADIALIISDYKMAGLTGLELCNLVAATWPEIPFALISGTAPSAMAEFMERNKVCSFIKKPVSKEQIEKVIQGKAQVRITEIRDERDIVASAVEEYSSSLEELEQLILELEENPADSAALNRIFGIIHTIKGSSSFFRPRSLTKFCHACEDAFTHIKSGQIPITSEIISVLLATRDVLVHLIDSLSKGDRAEKDLEELKKVFDPLKNLGANAAIKVKAGAQEADVESRRTKDWLKVSRVAIENFLKTNGEITILRNMIDKYLRHEFFRGRRTEEMEKLYRMFEQMFKHQGLMHHQMSELKKVALTEVFRQTRRIFRDLTRDLEKDVQINITGEDMRVDDSLIEIINTSLVHIVRNALDHGIEDRPSRAASGKSPQATLSVKIFEQDDLVILEISDDGRGIDPARIRQKLLETNLIPAADTNKLTEKELINFIYRPGFSTASKVTNVSGRGVGLDMVYTSIKNLRGTINVDSQVGIGTKFTIGLPIPKSIVIFKSLIVARAGLAYAVPQEGVRQVISAAFDEKSDQASIQTLEGRNVLKLRRENIPLYSLEEILGDVPLDRSHKTTKAEDQTVLILGTVNKSFGILIDSILGLEDTVVKPLGDNYENRTIYLGATILGDGEVGLVLNPEGIYKQVVA